MEQKAKTELENTVSDTSSSLSEALLFATMCIIGLPVDVHVRDGSVYSGIFYTTSVEKDFGIVLKRAKMTKKGKSATNVADGAIIETLVILSSDLVQVVAKGVRLSANGVDGNPSADSVEAFVEAVPASGGQVGQAKKSTKSGPNKRRNQKRNKNRDENVHCSGIAPAKAEKELEVQKPASQIRDAIEIEHAERDGTKEAEVVMNVQDGSGDLVNVRQTGDGRSQQKQDASTQTFQLHTESDAYKVPGSSLNSATCLPVDEGQSKMLSKQPNDLPNDPAPILMKPDNEHCQKPASADTLFSDASTSNVSTSCPDSIKLIPAQSTESSKCSKEFKLNPGAKMFSPSSADPTSTATPTVPPAATPALPAAATPSTPPAATPTVPPAATPTVPPAATPTVPPAATPTVPPAATPTVPPAANIAYVQNSPLVVPMPAAQSEVGINPFIPRTSVPAKFVPYANLAAANVGVAPQFFQPMVGNIGSRTQPIRYAGQYPMQAAPAYVHPNAPAVMLGRIGGQLVYLQPVANDHLVHGVAAMSPVSARPALSPHQFQFPKHHGAVAGQPVQFCVPSPIIAGGQQPFAIPAHIPVIPPPIPPNRPFPIPASNGLYATKFP